MICRIETGEAHECNCDECLETRVILGADTEASWRLILARIVEEEEEPCIA